MHKDVSVIETCCVPPLPRIFANQPLLIIMPLWRPIYYTQMLRLCNQRYIDSLMPHIIGEVKFGVIAIHCLTSLCDVIWLMVGYFRKEETKSNRNNRYIAVMKPRKSHHSIIFFSITMQDEYMLNWKYLFMKANSPKHCMFEIHATIQTFWP